MGLLAALLGALALGLALLWLRERRHANASAAAVGRVARSAAARTAAADDSRRAAESILDRLPDPLLLLSADGAVTRSNAAAKSLFGTEMAAVLRHPVLRAARDRAAASATTELAELDLAVPIARAVQAAIIPLDPALPDGATTLVVLSDRSRERAVERMRADFVANASHELRTPLASLIGFIDTLRGPAADDPPAQIRFLAIMAEQGARMARLIDDLLSLSRVELTEHLPPAEKIDLAAIVRSVAAGFEPRLAGRLVLDLAANLPPVAGDADQLTQVLSNLIDNAAKYGRPGTPVRVTLAAAPQGVVLSVADEGVGIPRAHLPRLTERFYRVDKARSRGAGGTGLGLAIVRHIVNRHRGRLAIDSEEGRGSTFSVWLPAEPATGSSPLTAP